MDITQELKDVKDGKTYFTTLINDLEAQKEEISQKLHLFKVANLVSVVEEFLENGSFEINDIHTIKIWNTFDDGLGYKIDFEYYDKDGDILIRFGDDGNFIEPVIALKRIFFDLENYNSAYIGERFPENAKVQFEIKKGCENEFIDLLLSKELKAAYQHSSLQNSMDKKETSNKKMKL